jgi:hypothetical protein
MAASPDGRPSAAEEMRASQSVAGTRRRAKSAVPAPTLYRAAHRWHESA